MGGFGSQTSPYANEIVPARGPESPAISVYDYIAMLNPQEANTFLMNKGMAPSRNYKELGGRLAMYVSKNGEQGLAEVSVLHPDKDLFERPSGFANCSGGCGGMNNCSGKPYNSCSGHNSANAYNGCCGNNSANGYNGCSGCGGKCGGKNNADGGGTPGPGRKQQDKDALIALTVILVVGVLALKL